MEKAVFCRDLFFSYDEADVLKGVSFDVEEGEYIGIIGPNGGGKSTLLKLILGFLEPKKGEIRVFGKPPLEAQRKTAYVPQNIRYDRHFPLSTLELVLGGRLSHLPWHGQFLKKDKEKGLEALAKVGLLELSGRHFGTLSGGEQQRSLIARALASEPKLLLLDEPTASVDIKAEREILSLLKSLKDEMTILMVTHDLQTTIDHFDRVLCVQQSVVSYSPKEVCEHYALGLYHPPLLNLKSGWER